VLVQRDSETIAHLASALQEQNPILVPHFDHDIQDLAALAVVAEHLFA